jgi:hypothetical protein
MGAKGLLSWGMGTYGIAISIGRKWWQTNVRIETLLHNLRGDVACTQEAQKFSFFGEGSRDIFCSQCVP